MDGIPIIGMSKKTVVSRDVPELEMTVNQFRRRQATGEQNVVDDQ
jgi:hypothetical protein